jgi:nitrite reductase (NADH) small subunit/3-phenylpropionate/trans-cinnamate dioxygenase ferredoxin subunit
MTTGVPAAKLRDVEPGTCLTVEVSGLTVALFNVNGTIYALDNTCPHAGGPLGEGILKEYVVECPWHGWRYNVRTGEKLGNPEFKVACYRVELEGDQILVHLPKHPPQL